MPNERIVLPAPQQIEFSGGTVEIPAAVTISGSADDATVQVVIETLLAAGVQEIRPGAELTIDVGFGSGDVLGRMGIDGPDDLPADGYVLATGSIEGRPHVVLSGVRPDPIDEKTPIKVAYDVVSAYLRSTLDA